MNMLAAMRADSVNLPVFVHVLGAMVLTGALLTVVVVSLMSWRRIEGGAGLTRLGFRTVLMAVFPAYLLMRIGAEWTVAEEFGSSLTDDNTPAWITMGYIASDLGALLLIVSMILAGIGLKKLRSGHGLNLNRVISVISILLLVAYTATIWAMSVKPV